MRTFKRAASVVFGLIVIFGVLIFILENQQPVALVFLGWRTPELPGSLLIICALLLGMAIGPVLGWLAYSRKARKLKLELMVQAKPVI